MQKETIYYTKMKSEEYEKILKYKNYGKNMFVPALISGVIMLIFAFIGDELLDIDVTFMIYIFLIFNIFIIIISIIKWVKYVHIGGYNCIIKGNNEILMTYTNVLGRIKLSDKNIMLGGTISQMHSDTAKVIGAGMIAASLLNEKDDTEVIENKHSEIKEGEIERIINDPKTLYDYYKDVKFLKKSKKYLYFNGNKQNDDGTIKNKNFKINRNLYEDIDNIIN